MIQIILLLLNQGSHLCQYQNEINKNIKYTEKYLLLSDAHSGPTMSVWLPKK